MTEDEQKTDPGSMSDANEPEFHLVVDGDSREPGTGMTEREAREFLSRPVTPVGRSIGTGRG